jgi:hypothetical protein
VLKLPQTWDLNVDIVLGDGQVGLGDRIYTSELRQHHGETPPARASTPFPLFIPLPERPTRCVQLGRRRANLITVVTLGKSIPSPSLDVNRKLMHDANSFSERFAAPLPILVWSMSMFEHHLDFISTLVQPAACK